MNFKKKLALARRERGHYKYFNLRRDEEGLPLKDYLIVTRRQMCPLELKDFKKEMMKYLRGYSGNITLDLKNVNGLDRNNAQKFIAVMVEIENFELKRGLELRLRGIKKKSSLKEGIELVDLSRMFAHPRNYWPHSSDPKSRYGGRADPATVSPAVNQYN